MASSWLLHLLRVYKNLVEQQLRKEKCHRGELENL